MTRILLCAAALALSVLAVPARASVLKQIGEDLGATIEQVPTDDCRKEFKVDYCYKATQGDKTSIIPANSEQDLRDKLKAAGFGSSSAAAPKADSLAACIREWRMGERGDGRANCSDAYLSDIMRAHNRACYSLITASRDKAATECKKSAAPTIAMGLDDPDPKKWNEANCKARFEDAKQPVPEGHPCKAIVAAPKEACDKAMDPKNEGTKDKDVAAQRDSCLARRDQDMGIDREKLKTPEQCQKAMQAQEESKDPEAKKVSGRLSDICGSVVADMLKNIKDNKAEYPAGVLAWFQSDCAKHPEHQSVCIATGFQKKIPEKVVAAPAYSSEADRQALQTACKGVDGKAGDPAACTRFERLTQIEQLSGRCTAGEMAACEKQSRLVTQEEIEKRPQVKRAMAYGATVDQAARYDSYIQRHFKKSEQQDLMERLMRANPETMGKLMDENTQCEKKGGAAAAACDKKFYTNYMALADGHPVSDTGRRYLANMCAMPENKDVEACKDKKAYTITPRKAAAPPAPVSGYRRPTQPRADPDPISSIITGLMRPFGNSNPKGYVCRLKGTDIACSSAGQQGCECREIR